MAIKVTTMIGDNYGSALQAYALQQVIKEIGGGGQALLICVLRAMLYAS